MNKTKFGLTATHLRILALFLMLLDHLWATVVPGNNWMTYVGRMAFPSSPSRRRRAITTPTILRATAGGLRFSPLFPRFPST